jgi:hypothetical protein
MDGTVLLTLYPRSASGMRQRMPAALHASSLALCWRPSGRAGPSHGVGCGGTGARGLLGWRPPHSANTGLHHQQRRNEGLLLHVISVVKAEPPSGGSPPVSGPDSAAGCENSRHPLGF